jgi:DNA ligase (NAD+)
MRPRDVNEHLSPLERTPRPDDRAQFLRDELAYHEHREHVLESPLIPGRKYWEMRRELTALEAGGVPVSPDSSSLRAGSVRRVGFEPLAHRVPWAAPPAIRSPAELRRFHELVAEREGASPVYIGAARLSGAEVALTYVDGVLERAVTRGNGREGEDVTANVRTIGSVPLLLRPPGTITESRVTQLTKQALGPSTMTPVPPFPAEMTVRGMVSMRTADLVALDRRRIDAGEPPYVDPAAAVVASLRRLDPRITGARRLVYFAHSLARVPPGIDSHWQVLGALKSWGFRVLPLAWRCVGVEEVLDFVTALQHARPTFELPFDGGLVTLSRALDDEASTLPRTVALSFVAAGRRARVPTVYRAVGRGGAVLPVALLARLKDDDPAVPEGAPVPAISGDRVLGVEPGATVRVVPGALAPQLVLEASDGRPPSAVPPSVCSACQGPVHLAPDEPFGRCENARCTGRRRSRILHLIGARGLAIGSLGARAAEALLVSDEPPLLALFGLDPARVEEVSPGAGESFRAERERHRKLPLWRALYLASIPEVGERAARLVAAAYDTEAMLLERGPTTLGQVSELPPEALGPLSAWLHTEARGWFSRLGELGVEILSDGEAYAAPLAGKRLVVAGKLEKLTPEQAVDEIERRGGSVEPRVTRMTDLVVAGAGASEAVASAEAYGVLVVEEAALYGLLRLSTA